HRRPPRAPAHARGEPARPARGLRRGGWGPGGPLRPPPPPPQNPRGIFPQAPRPAGIPRRMKNTAFFAVGALFFAFSQLAAASGVSGPPTSFAVSVSASEIGDHLDFAPVLSATPGGDFTGSAAGSSTSFSFSSSFILNTDP